MIVHSKHIIRIILLIIMNSICPICGYIYDEKYQVVHPSICLVCQLEIEIAKIQFDTRKKSKEIWHERIFKIHEEMMPIILHPDRLSWFLPEYT